MVHNCGHRINMTKHKKMSHANSEHSCPKLSFCTSFTQYAFVRTYKYIYATLLLAHSTDRGQATGHSSKPEVEACSTAQHSHSELPSSLSKGKNVHWLCTPQNVPHSTPHAKHNLQLHTFLLRKWSLIKLWMMSVWSECHINFEWKLSFLSMTGHCSDREQQLWVSECSSMMALTKVDNFSNILAARNYFCQGTVVRWSNSK